MNITYNTPKYITRSLLCGVVFSISVCSFAEINSIEELQAYSIEHNEPVAVSITNDVATNDIATNDIVTNDNATNDAAMSDAVSEISFNMPLEPTVVENEYVNTLENHEDAFALDDKALPDNKGLHDPLEGYNRWMFGVNLALDKSIVRPVSNTYKNNAPGFVQSGVRNFFHNLKEPWVATNLLLQGYPLQSLESLSRFGINTVTSLGLADPAGSVFNLTRYNEDFGQTLGSWGVPAGAYIVLPFFGPSSIRDAGGRFVDGFGDPIAYMESTPAKIGLKGTYGVAKRADLMKYEGILEPTYEVVRDAYFQKREFDIETVDLKNDTNDQKENEGFEEGFGD